MNQDPFEALRTRLQTPAEGPKLRGPRDEGIQRFVDRKCIKVRDRKTKELRLATPTEIAKRLGFVKTDELHILYQKCDRADEFSKMFWFYVNPKNNHGKATNQKTNP
jgi:hypothetical protein